MKETELQFIQKETSSLIIGKWECGVGGTGYESHFKATKNTRLLVQANQLAAIKTNINQMIIYIPGPYNGGFVEHLNVKERGLFKKQKIASISEFEVYFTNLSDEIEMKFGVPFFQVREENGRILNVAVRGTMVFHLMDYMRFITVVGLRNLSIADFRKMIAEQINSASRETVLSLFKPGAENISNLNINKEEVISKKLFDAFDMELYKKYGISLKTVLITGIDIQ